MDFNFNSVEEIDKRLKELEKQKQILYEENKKLNKTIRKVEAEIYLLRKIYNYMKGNYENVFDFQGDRGGILW